MARRQRQQPIVDSGARGSPTSDSQQGAEGVWLGEDSTDGGAAQPFTLTTFPHILSVANGLLNKKPFFLLLDLISDEW